VPVDAIYTIVESSGIRDTKALPSPMISTVLTTSR